MSEGQSRRGDDLLRRADSLLRWLTPLWERLVRHRVGVANLGLVVIWDDGDDLHAEPRAPYPHAREVLALRAHRARAAALIGGFARTAEATSLVASWGVTRRIVWAWVLTIPGAALFGAVLFKALAHVLP